jgi:SpoVK/Ycf46/Vps4 family AAA+-type ATPase
MGWVEVVCYFEGPAAGCSFSPFSSTSPTNPSMIFGKKQSQPPYKVKHFQAYNSAQVRGSKRKYRTVFEQSELTYINVELAMINKWFDEEDWSATFGLKVYRKEGEKWNPLFEHEEEVTVKQDRSEYAYRGGWGKSEKGGYWRRGSFLWEVYIDEEMVQNLVVHVEDAGAVSLDHNPYFRVKALRTYESATGTLEKEKRVYLKTFEVDNTRYIMGELECENLLPHDWQMEIIFNMYDDTGLLVGSADIVGMVYGTEESDSAFEITGGYGSSAGDFWTEDQYTMEVIFMDTVIALVPFSVGKKAEERLSPYEALLNEEVAALLGEPQIIKKSNAEQGIPDPDPEPEIDPEPEPEPEPEAETESSPAPEPDPRSAEELLAELRSLIGLENIKAKIDEYLAYIRFLQYRRQAGIEEEEQVNLHSVFTGNPGTGKTTVVKLLGKIFQSMGLLSKGHVHQVDASDLVVGYVRQTGKATQEQIEKARGGILFIDEAYMLFRKGMDSDFGPEAIAELLTEMSDGPGDIAIMVAGYPDEMKSFLESNPGLKSRFRHYFHFEDYKPGELFQIAQLAAKKKAVSLSEAAAERLRRILQQAFRERDRNFGNARFAYSLIDEAKINLGIRLMQQVGPEELDVATLSTLKAEDIEDIRKADPASRLRLRVDEALLQQALAELNGLTGLASIKQEVQELIKLSRYYREHDRDLLKAFSMHAVFMGNPGTGKTTVARILARVYKALGLLERGHLIDADGSDLVAGYVGQTALKTKEVIQKARGGLLLIDEAYALTDQGNTDFGRKAIATLVKEMEDHRSEFGLIVAGYPDPMQQFLESNPGLKSRFDRTFTFEDFRQEELWEIALNMFAAKGLHPNSAATRHLKAYLGHLYQHRDRFFGNARSVRKIVERATRRHELRMADLPKSKRSKRTLTTLSLADVSEFDALKQATEAGRSQIGFVREGR